MMTKTIVWIYPDCLSSTHPALLLHRAAPAVFVWDDEWLATAQISLKRIQFIYEGLLELPVAIRRGDVAAEVLQFAADHHAMEIATAHSVDPRFHAHAQRVAAVARLQVYSLPPFLDCDASKLDLKRFSRYWRTAKKQAYDYTVSA